MDSQKKKIKEFLKDITNDKDTIDCLEGILSIAERNYTENQKRKKILEICSESAKKWNDLGVNEENDN